MLVGSILAVCRSVMILLMRDKRRFVLKRFRGKADMVVPGISPGRVIFRKEGKEAEHG
jgi:hypothetical protein